MQNLQNKWHRYIFAGALFLLNPLITYGVQIIEKSRDFTYAQDPADILYVAFGSYTQAGGTPYGTRGYTHSLPFFIQKLIQEDHVPVKIILFDPEWAGNGYEQSDLKRYLNTLPAKTRHAIEQCIYLVPQPAPHTVFGKLPHHLNAYLCAAAHKKAYIFLVDAFDFLLTTGPGSLFELHACLQKQTPRCPEHVQLLKSYGFFDPEGNPQALWFAPTGTESNDATLYTKFFARQFLRNENNQKLFVVKYHTNKLLSGDYRPGSLPDMALIYNMLQKKDIAALRKTLIDDTLGAVFVSLDKDYQGKLPLLTFETTCARDHAPLITPSVDYTQHQVRLTKKQLESFLDKCTDKKYARFLENLGLHHDDVEPKTDYALVVPASPCSAV